MKFRHYLIVLLVVINLWINYGFVANSYEALISFVTLTVPLGVFLFGLSFISKKKDTGWQKNIDYWSFNGCIGGWYSGYLDWLLSY